MSCVDCYKYIYEKLRLVEYKKIFNFWKLMGEYREEELEELVESF